MNRGKVGGLATFIAGGAYLFVLISTIFGHGGPYSPWLLAAFFSVAAFLSVAVLAAVFRPETLWAFPALFSGPLVWLSTFYLWDWVGLLVFLAIIGATFLVGVAACATVRALLAARGMVP